uniref:Uncharacterized protein n=1 Tax=Lactuca sativa TaxID=4236 RepID=A0A9R1W4D9_LACSA|nr:hypothetical protein LSAT_V11C300123050 [Lactuca sativa]
MGLLDEYREVFYIKKMIDVHKCVRNFNNASLMNPTWLARNLIVKYLGQCVIELGWVWDYANELLRANLDSTIKIIVIVNPNETTCNIPKPEGVLAMYVRRKP